jgi:large subunit ribosomal protein L32e
MKKIVQLKRRKPSFVRVEQHRYKRLKRTWRRPKGHHGRIKKLLSYHKGAAPKVGYGTPLKFRELHPSGYVGVLVYNVTELEKINPQIQAAIIAKVGRKNKILIVEKAIEKKIKILNLRKPEDWLKENKKPEIRQPKAATTAKGSQHTGTATPTNDEGVKK